MSPGNLANPWVGLYVAFEDDVHPLCNGCGVHAVAKLQGNDRHICSPTMGNVS